MATASSVFGPKIAEVSKELRAAARQGREAVIEFVALPHIRKTAAIKEALDEVTTGNPVTLKSLLDTNGVTDPLAAAELVLKWALSLDPHSIQVQRAKWDADQAAKKADKEKREAERAKAKEEKAKEAAAKVVAA